MLNNYKKNKLKNKLAMSLIEVVISMAIFGAIAGFIFTVLYPKIQSSLIKNQFLSDFNAIMSGLNEYYGVNQQYPSGSGYKWNEAEAFISNKIINKGWQYKCENNIMTIESPVISNKKALVILKSTFSSIVKSENGTVQIKTNGKNSNISIILPGKPCPSNSQNQTGSA